MRINHNTSALNTNRQMTVNVSSTSKAMEKLSSGLRINRAADDAAGLSISEKMRAQIRSLDQAVRNAQDGISLIQTAEGALNEVSDMLGRMKELLVQKSSGTYSTEDTANIDLELDALGTAIDKVLDDTSFNGIKMLKNDAAIENVKITDDTGANIIEIGKITFKGTTDFAKKDVTVEKESVTYTKYADEDGNVAFKAGDDWFKPDLTAVESGFDSDGFEKVQVINPSITEIDTAIDAINKDRAQFGAYQNQLEHTVNNYNTTAENLTSSESRIRDVDMAKEMTEFTKNNILLQASQAMLAQANSQPQNILQLLR